MRLRRLSGRKICERVKSKGFLWKGKHLQARYTPGLPRGLREDSPLGVYVGTLTSAKLDKSAVRRNRMRRRCREALRVAMQKFDSFPAIQLLMMPRSSSLQCEFGEIVADINALLSHLKTVVAR